MIITILVVYLAVCFFAALAIALAMSGPGHKTTVTIFGRKVEDPILKLIGGTLVIAVIIPWSIIGVPVHIALRLTGRQGFWKPEINSWQPMHPEGFKKKRNPPAPVYPLRGRRY